MIIWEFNSRFWWIAFALRIGNYLDLTEVFTFLVVVHDCSLHRCNEVNSHLAHKSQPLATSFNSVFSDIMLLAAWSQPSWDYICHGNHQNYKPGLFSPKESVAKYLAQHTTGCLYVTSFSLLHYFLVLVHPWVFQRGPINNKIYEYVFALVIECQFA